MGVGVGDYPWWEYAIMPFIAGIIGYVTNVLALQMMFYPTNFWGIELWRMHEQPLGLIGWQGVIPTKARKMASVCYDIMTEKLLDVKEIFSRLEPAKFSEVMEEGLLLLIDSILNDVGNAYMPKAWNNLPQDVRDELVVVADRESEAFLRDFMADMQRYIEDVLDIKEMTVTAVVENKNLLNKVFQEVGDKEFTFIRRSGFYFGFLFGCVQTLVWFFYDANWILPVCGFLVGWLTNWLALKVIFRPVNPTKVGCFTLHGLFLRRQMEVSEVFARVNCVEILHTKAMWDAIFTGPLHKNFFAMLRAHSLVFTERLVGGLKPIAIVAMGADKFAQMKEDIATKVMERLPSIIDQSYEYTTEALQMEATMREKMQGITYEEFEGVLHPAFEEDEILLIIVGGVLGLIVGVCELFVLFA